MRAIAGAVVIAFGLNLSAAFAGDSIPQLVARSKPAIQMMALEQLNKEAVPNKEFNPEAVGTRSVSAIAGNIFLTDIAGKSKQLTSSGLDTEPLLSPDGKWIVFVRATSGELLSSVSQDDIKPTQLWQIGANGENATLLVRCQPKTSGDISKMIVEFYDTQFSSNGRYVYFMTSAWFTTNAVHVVDTTNANEHFVCAARDFEILTSHKHRDCLLVKQHCYGSEGAYDQYFVLNPNGEKVDED